MTVTSADERHMAAAILLSRTHTGQTATNPSVGCIIVKDDVVLGSAVTAIGGRPHAETQALAMAGEGARGATAYVTLEPCSHYGRTPPCANALVEAGIARVVVAMTDPDPRVSGKGLAILQGAGIEVVTGVLQEKSCEALRAYLTRQMKARPYVTLKLALSADGMIGRVGDGQIAITGPVSREQVHRMRAEMDAILVGIGTALADDPQLDVRLSGLEHRSPVRVVLDRHLRLPLNSKLVRTARQYPVIAVGDRFCDRAASLIEAGVEVLDVPDLAALLRNLAARGFSSLLVEGGASVAKAFLDAGLVDRIVLFEGPVTIGEGGIESPVSHHNIPADYKPVQRMMFGADQCCEFERKFECSQAS